MISKALVFKMRSTRTPEPSFTAVSHKQTNCLYRGCPPSLFLPAGQPRPKLHQQDRPIFGAGEMQLGGPTARQPVGHLQHSKDAWICQGMLGVHRCIVTEGVLLSRLAKDQLDKTCHMILLHGLRFDDCFVSPSHSFKHVYIHYNSIHNVLHTLLPAAGEKK